MVTTHGRKLYEPRSETESRYRNENSRARKLPTTLKQSINARMDNTLFRRFVGKRSRNIARDI